MALSYLSQGRLLSLEPVPPDDSTILFDPAIERGADELGERLRGPIQKYSPKAWVIRGSSADFCEMLEDDPILPDLAAAAAVPILGLAGSHDEADLLPRLWTPGWASLEPPRLSLEEIREAELLGILEGAGAIHKLDHFHYILPSRHHAREFIRLADALQDPIDTVRIVDWLLPYLREESWAIADTGTLLPLLFALKAEARNRLDFDIQVANLSEYPADYISMDDLLGELHGQRPAHTLLIVSVSSSGNVAEQFARLRKGDHDVVVLCDSGTGGEEALSRYPIERWRADEHGKCEECKSLHDLVVDPHTYQVLPVSGLETIPFDFDKAAELEDFWRLADRTDAVRLHYDEVVPAGRSPGRRHMSIDIDISALLEDEPFKLGVVAKLAAGSVPERVLIPDHDAADAMCELALAAFPGLDRQSIHRVRGATLDAAVVEDLETCERVLLLDDSAVTGNTLSSLRREIYERGLERFERAPDVDAFVVLARPDSDSDETAVRRPLTKKGDSGRPTPGYRYAERVLLPPHDDCPWCSERERLAQLTARIPEHAEFTRERDELLSSTDGLRPPILPTKVDRPNHRTHGSFIGDLKPAAAFAATASAAQGLTSKLVKKRRGAQVALVDVGLVTEAFFDPIIVAGILRVVPKRFLRHYSQDAEVNDRLAKHAVAFGEHCLAEIAWAAAQGYIPREAIYAALVRAEDPSPELAAYRALLEALDPSLAPDDVERAEPIGA